MNKINERKYQICTKTIMDNSDPNIVFNSEGESDYYTNKKADIDRAISNLEPKAVDEYIEAATNSNKSPDLSARMIFKEKFATAHSFFSTLLQLDAEALKMKIDAAEAATTAQ